MVYVKNLPRSIGKEEMVALFDRFEKQTVIYTLLTGRMRGQAFVEFCWCESVRSWVASKENAAEAVNRLHGFVFKGRPLILQFKR